LKSHTEYLSFNIPTRVGFVNITPRVEEAVRKSSVREGIVLVNAMHITASVFINDDESGLHEDYRGWLEGLAPFDPSPQRYKHNRTGEDNADAHLKRQVMGRHYRRKIGLRPVGAGLLRRVRWRAAQAGPHQDPRRMSVAGHASLPIKRRCRGAETGSRWNPARSRQIFHLNPASPDAPCQEDDPVRFQKIPSLLRDLLRSSASSRESKNCRNSSVRTRRLANFVERNREITC